MQEVVETFKRLQLALDSSNLPRFCLKPKQVQCFEYLLQGFDVVTVLPTGFGKSLLFQLLPDFLPVKASQNIVLVICPLSSIIEDQISVLNDMGICADVLPIEIGSRASESLFERELNQLSSEVGDTQACQGHKFSKTVVEGKAKIVFGHPEALLSDDGRKLLNSEVYQKNVVACVIDEAHCIEMWGEDFRTDFKGLSCLKAFFPRAQMLALTATAPPLVIEKLAQSLCMNSKFKTIKKNPNRENVFLGKRMRLPNQYGTASYERILIPIAQELLKARENYPITIVYMKLKYCGFAYALFNRILGNNQFVGSSRDPSGRLFAQYHAPQTSQMKSSILSEIKKEHSRIRVIFATTALGMGVNVPNVSKIIHISPPSSLESYVQEIGRAGRSGHQASAILYFNNSDIAQNKGIIDDSIREYCISEKVCLRKLLLDYFGFTCKKQQNCCAVCNGEFTTRYVDMSKLSLKENMRNMPAHNAEIVYEKVKFMIEKYMCNIQQNSMMYYPAVDSDSLAKKILNEVSYIETETDLLQYYGIWDENCSSALFNIITMYAPHV